MTSKRWLIAAGIAVFVLVGGGWYTCGFRGCPDPEDLLAYEPGGAPQILDRDGEPFATLLPVQREVVEIDSLPEQRSHGDRRGLAALLRDPPTELSPAQSALLAAMVKAPGHYDPRDDEEEALERRNLVLDLMGRAGFLTAEEVDTIDTLRTAPPDTSAGGGRSAGAGVPAGADGA